MNKKNTPFIIGIIFVLFFIILLQSSHIVRDPYDNTNINTCDQTATTTDCGKILSPFDPIPIAYENKESEPLKPETTNNWNIFKNTKYHYLLLYPPLVDISTNNDYAIDLSKEKSLGFSVPGKTIGGIDVYTIEPWEEKFYKTKATDPEKKFFEENKKIISLDLKSYAEYIRNLQVNNKAPYIKDREKVGDMQEISFANTKAYRFTLTKGFESLSEKYALPSGIFTYLITENPIGQKMIIHYLSGNEISEKMIQSFQFIK